MKYSIHFSTKGATGAPTVAIRCRVSWGCQRVDVNTGYAVPVGGWNASKERVRATAKGTHPPAEINAELNRIAATVSELFTRADLAGSTPTKEEVTRALRRLRTGKPVTAATIEEVMLEFIGKEQVSRSWAPRTQDTFHALLYHLRIYAPGALMSDISEEWIYGLYNYFIAIPLKNLTIQTHFQRLRWFLRWATRRKYITSEVWEEYKPQIIVQQQDTNVIYLTWEELMTYYNFDFQAAGRPGLDASRDYFCFSAFTGLRQSDMRRVRISDITGDILCVTTQKTHKTLYINLNKYAKTIIDKYRPYADAKGYLWHVPNVARYNINIHAGTELAGITTPVTTSYYIGGTRHEVTRPKCAAITSHAARRTFVIHSLRLGIPAEVIMRWTGHSRHDRMRPYISIADDIKAKEMAKWDE